MRRAGVLIAAAIGLPPGTAMAAGGLPQIDFANPLTLSQVGWGAVIFVVFYLLLRNWALPQVDLVLTQRAAVIEADLDAARQAKASADAAAAASRQATADARAQAQAAVNQAAERAKAEAQARSATLAARLDAQLAEAERRIAALRQAAMASLRGAAAETAEVLIARLASLALPPGAVDTAVGAALAERGQG